MTERLVEHVSKAFCRESLRHLCMHVCCVCVCIVCVCVCVCVCMCVYVCVLCVCIVCVLCVGRGKVVRL